MSAVIIIVAATLALVLLSLLMLAVCCLFRQRRKDVEHLGDELGSLEDRLSPVKRIQPNIQLQTHGGKEIGPPWPSASHRPKNTILLDPTDALVPGLPRATTMAENSSSIYSTESAPLHFHDQLSNPLFVNRVVMSNVARANLPRGMNLPSSVTRDLGLFMTTLPESGTGDLPHISHSARFRTLVPQLPHPARSPYLRVNVNPQTLRKTTSTSSFPPPLW